MKKLKVIISGLLLLSILWVGSSSGFGILADQSQVVGSPGGASSTSPFVTVGNDASLTHERALTGTTNQIVITDNGLNTTVTLSTPQNIHTGASPTFAALTLSTTPLVVGSGGIGVGTLTDGGVLIGSGTVAVTAMAVLVDGAIVIGDGVGDPVAYSAFSSSTGTLNVSAGGSGAATFTDGSILLGSGTGAFTVLGVASNGEILIGDGVGDPVLATLTGTANEVDITNAAGSITIGLPSNITIAGILTVDGDLIRSGSVSGTLTHAVPGTITTYTVTWPNAVAGAGEVLTDAAGDGTLSWGAAGGSITALNNQAENRMVTIGATTTELDGEATLTFDGSTLRHSGPSFARYITDHTAAAADEKLYDYINIGGRLIIRALSDAVGVGQAFVDMDRTGTIIDTIAFETGRADYAFGSSVLGGSFMAFTVDGVPRNMMSGRGLGFYIFSSSQIVNTSGNGETIANGALVIFGQPTWRSSGTTFTITDASTLYIENAPVASTNTTFTREYAAWFDDGDIRIDGVLRYGNQVNVSQGTDINTAVTSDGNTGVITTQTASTGIGNSDTFTVNNSLVAVDDVIDVAIQSYSGTLETNGLPVVLVSAVASGSFDISIYNVDGTNALSGTFVINYAIRGGGIS